MPRATTSTSAREPARASGTGTGSGSSSTWAARTATRARARRSAWPRAPTGARSRPGSSWTSGRRPSSRSRRRSRPRATSTRSATCADPRGATRLPAMDPSEDRTAPLDHSLGSARFTQPYVGARFGRFEILSELGRGGYGAVFRARDTLSGQEVALKLLLSSVVDERDIERFRREALVATRVRHPGIVPVLDAGTAEGKPFVSMGLVAGQPLHKLELTLEDHVRVLVRVARAVGAAHKVGVIHRDLKPPNVIVNPKTQAPVVLDFGLAFDERLTRLSRTGEIMGSPVWMAPETVRGDARPDARLDVYALGLMLYSRLAG